MERHLQSGLASWPAKLILVVVGMSAAGCGMEIAGPDSPSSPAAVETTTRSLTDPGVPAMEYGPIPRLVGLRFIRLRASEGDQAPVFVARLKSVVAAANNIYDKMGLKFFIQAIDDGVAPNLAAPAGTGSYTWEDIWSEAAQVAPVSHETYAPETTMSPSAWLHVIAKQNFSPLTAIIWVLPAGTPYVNQGARPSGDPVTNSIIVRADVQNGSRDNFAHELGHWLNLTHTDNASSTAGLNYSTPPDPTDNPRNICILWDHFFIPAGITPQITSNRYFYSRVDCENFLATRGLSYSAARSLSLDDSPANKCSAECIADHANGCSADRPVCVYLIDSATRKRGMRHYDEWYTSDDPQLKGVSQPKNGKYSYEVMSYAPFGSWNHEHMVSPAQVEAIEKTFLYHQRTAASCAGQTEAGHTNWVQHGSTGIYVDVDTSDCGFTSTPLYFSSLGGAGAHWDVMGSSSIYSPTPTGFRIYVNVAAGISPALANQNGWRINWQAHPPGLNHPAGTAAETLCTGEGTGEWQQAGANVVIQEIDTTACGFTDVPQYFTSLGGFGSHWTTRGATSVRLPTPTGFHVAVHQNGITPEVAAARGWNINWKALLPNSQFAYTCTGKSVGGTNATWQTLGGGVLFMDVDTSACSEFTEEPLVFTSLEGNGSHSVLQGVTSIHDPTAAGFRIYLKSGVTAAVANSTAWAVNWALHPRRQLIRPICPHDCNAFCAADCAGLSGNAAVICRDECETWCHRIECGGISGT